MVYRKTIEGGKMTRIKILGLAVMVMVVVLLPNNAPAQPPDTLWTKTYGCSYYDCGYSVVQTTEGYIIAGWTGFPSSSDVYLIKTDVNGDTLWTRTYGGNGADVGSSVVQTSDDGYIIAGYTESYGVGDEDVYLIRIDVNGDTLWTKTYGGSNLDIGYSVVQTRDGGYIIAGSTKSFGAGVGDVYLIKTDAKGDTLWTKTCGGSSEDRGFSVVQTNDGGYIIVGETHSYGAGSSDVYLIKTDVNGDTLWTRTYGGNGADVGSSVVQTSDDGYIIAGYTESYGVGDEDVYLIRIDVNGDTLWTKTYGGSNLDIGYSVVQTRDGGYIIAGSTKSFGAGVGDVYLIKTDAKGDTLWTKTCGGSKWDYGYSVRQTSDGGYVIAGLTFSYGIGIPNWSNVYLIRLGPETGIEENSNLTVRSPNLHFGQNPFSTTTTISYQIPARSEISLSVYDITGREIKRLVDGVQERGDYHLQLDMTCYAQGVYFINLTAGKVRSVKKVIVLR